MVRGEQVWTALRLAVIEILGDMTASVEAAMCALKRSQLDRLYHRVIDDLDALVEAVGLGLVLPQAVLGLTNTSFAPVVLGDATFTAPLVQRCPLASKWLRSARSSQMRMRWRNT